MTAFLLWPLAALELAPRAIAHLNTALTRNRRKETTTR